MTPHETVEIRWATGDPHALALRLRESGFEIDRDGVLTLPRATIRIEAGTGPADRLEVADGPRGTSAAVSPHRDTIEDIVAIGWATVDRERFLADLGAASNADLSRDPHLGAFAIRQGATAPGPQVLVLEPDTEGRLAATLVRCGEGPAAIYFAAHGGLEAFVADAGRRGTSLSSVRPGPLGPSVLLLGGPMWGPHLLVVDRPSGGTIAT